MLKAGDGTQGEGRLIRDRHVGDVIQSVIDHIAPVFAVRHKVVALVMQDQLIWADVLLWRFMQFPVNAELIIVVMDLLPLLDGHVDQLYVKEHGPVLCFIPIFYCIDILEVGTKIRIGKAA